MYGRSIQGLFLLTACTTACKDAGHHVVLRVEGTDLCGSEIWARPQVNGELKLEHFQHVQIPFEKEFDPNTSELDVDVHATTATCPEVHCQLSVDGKVVDIKADVKVANCTWKRPG